MLPKNWVVRITRQKRKTLSVSVKGDGSILVKAPAHMREQEIVSFLEEKRRWIERQMDRVKRADREAELEGSLSQEELGVLKDVAKRVIPARVEYYAGKLGVTYGRITIRSQKTCWGSCTANGNLNFNCLLMLAPTEVADYVVVHELCHRLEMNHSARFWELVEGILPDYRLRRKWLKENGATLMRRMKNGLEEGSE